MSHAANNPQPTPTRPAQSTARTCPKCGTPMNAQAVNHYHAGRQGHGCLFSILFGVGYWIWLGIKWMFQFMYKIIVWVIWLMAVFFFYIYAAIANCVRAIRKQATRWTIPNGIMKIAHSSIHRSRNGKNTTATVWVCPNCGNTING